MKCPRQLESTRSKLYQEQKALHSESDFGNQKYMFLSLFYKSCGAVTAKRYSTKFFSFVRTLETLSKVLYRARALTVIFLKSEMYVSECVASMALWCSKQITEYRGVEFFHCGKKNEWTFQVAGEKERCNFSKTGCFHFISHW